MTRHVMPNIRSHTLDRAWPATPFRRAKWLLLRSIPDDIAAGHANFARTVERYLARIGVAKVSGND